MAGQDESDKIVKANVGDLISVLNQIDWKNGLKSFVYISSSDLKLRKQTMYSRTKKASEEILLAYMEKYNAPITIVRPFSVTGAGEQPEHLIPTLIRSCMVGEEMPFVPDACHDFVDVEDVVEGILNLSGRHEKGIFELGSGKSYRNDQVKDIVEKATGKKAKINIVRNLRSYDNWDWVSRNFRAREYGWKPTKTLEQSISEMVEQYVK